MALRRRKQVQCNLCGQIWVFEYETEDGLHISVECPTCGIVTEEIVNREWGKYGKQIQRDN